MGKNIFKLKFCEETILNAAYKYEQATKFRDKYKPEFIK